MTCTIIKSIDLLACSYERNASQQHFFIDSQSGLSKNKKIKTSLHKTLFSDNGQPIYLREKLHNIALDSTSLIPFPYKEDHSECNVDYTIVQLLCTM